MRGRDIELNKGGAPPDSERMAYPEEELKAAKKQVQSQTERFFGCIAILCLPPSPPPPPPRGRRLDLGFRQAEHIPNGIPAVTAKRRISESGTGGLDFDYMPSLLVAVFGLEREWNTIGIDRLRDAYGGYAALMREDTAKSQPCEG